MPEEHFAIPKWDGDTAYPEYRAMVDLWASVTSLPPSKRAAALTLNLSGQPRAVALQLGVPMLSQENGIDVLMKKFDELYRQDSSDRIFTDLVQFIRIRRFEPDMQHYVARFRLRQARAEGHMATQQPFPSEFLSALLIEGAALSSTDRKLVLAAIQGDLSCAATTGQALKKLFQNTPPCVQAAVLAAERIEPREISNRAAECRAGVSESASGSDATSSASAEGSDLQRAYLAYKRAKKKYRSSNEKAAHPNKQDGNPIDRRTGAQLRCFCCGAYDHLVPRCPKRHEFDVTHKPGAKSHGEQPAAAKEKAFVVNYAGIAGSGLVNDCDEWADAGAAEHTALSASSAACVDLASKCERGQWMVVDSGATATLVSFFWLTRHRRWLAQQGKEMRDMEPSNTVFRFGNGELASVVGRADVPLCILGEWCTMSTYVLDGSCPALLSRHALNKMRGVVDFGESTLDIGVLGKKVRLRQSESGHLLLFVADIGNAPQTSNACATDVLGVASQGDTDEAGHDEYAWTATTLSELRQARGPKLQRLLLKLHIAYGHASVFQMKKLLVSAPDLHPSVFAAVESVVRACQTCRALENAPAIPVASRRTAAAFGEEVHVDLLFCEEIIALHCVDSATHFCQLILTPSKETRDVWAAMKQGWIKPFGAPLSIISDSGGEFSSNFYADVCADMDIELRLKPKGSHVFLTESRNAVAKSAYQKLVLEHPDTTPMDLLLSMTRVLNAMIQSCGYSADQCVFGASPRDITDDSRADAENVRYYQNLTASCVYLSAMKLRTVAREAVQNATEQERLRRLMRHQNQYKGTDVRLGDQVIFYRSANARLGSRWCGPAEVLKVQSDSVVLSYQGGVRSVARHLVRSWCSGEQENEGSQVIPASPAAQEVTFLRRNEADASGRGFEQIDTTDLAKLKCKELQRACAQLGQKTYGSKQDLINRLQVARGADAEREQSIPADVASDEEPCPDRKRRAPELQQLEIEADCQSPRGKIARCNSDANQAFFVKEQRFLSEFFPSWDHSFASVCHDMDQAHDDAYRTYVAHAYTTAEIIRSKMLTSEELGIHSGAVLIAKREELEAWQQHGVYTEEDEETVDRRVIDTRWVITWKDAQTGDGGLSIKARLVAKGYQDPDVFNAKILLAASMATRMSHLIVCSTAALRGWRVWQMDIAKAFLKSDKFGRTVFLRPPVECGTKCVWHLTTPVYGLNDAPSHFHRTLRKYLLNKEFWTDRCDVFVEETELDACLYRVTDCDGQCVGIFSTHVDDLLLASTASSMADFEYMMTARFDRLKVATPPFTHCALDISQADDFAVTICQARYINSLSPLPTTSHMWRQRGDALPSDELGRLRTLLGQLSHVATASRPDLCASVGEIAARVNKLRVHDMFKLNDMLGLAKETAEDAALKFTASMRLDCIQVVLYADGCVGPKDKLNGARAGVIVALCDGFPRGNHHVVHWSSRKLRKVAKSSLSAEIHAVSLAAQLAPLLKSLYVSMFANPVRVIMVNDCYSLFAHLKSGRALADKLTQRPFLEIQELLLEGCLSNLAHMRGKDHPADALTSHRKDAVSLIHLLCHGKLKDIEDFEWLY